MTTARSVPAAAPGRLVLVQTFLNTLHVEKGLDALGDPATAYDWRPGPGPGRPGARDLDRLRDLRRELRSRCGDGEPDDARFDELAAAIPLRLTAGGGLGLAAAGDGHRAVAGELLAITYDAHRDGTWARLKICRHDDCRWAFYDESRSRTATWCAMGICGNRTKVAAYRRRHS